MVRFYTPLSDPLRGPMDLPMTHLPEAAWLLIAGVGASAILGALFALAVRLRDEIAIHDLRVRAESLRRTQQARLKALRSAEFADVDLDDATLLRMVGGASSKAA